MDVDRIVVPHGRGLVPAWARRARGPGGVVSDAQGRVLANVLQQDLDQPPEPRPPWAVRAAEQERPQV